MGTTSAATTHDQQKSPTPTRQMPESQTYGRQPEHVSESSPLLHRYLGNSYVQAMTTQKQQLGLQTKLKVNEPGDIYEREADRVADQVLATSAHHAVSGAPPRIQRFSGQSHGQTDGAPASVDQVLGSPGRPLEPALRQDMEQRFGHDFSHVRLHTGAAAEQSAQDVNAQAYTVGHNIVFGAGRFAPETRQGRRLIAHELTHVVQQTAVGRMLARQPVDTDQTKSSRRSIVIWERAVGQRVKLKTKLSVRGQVPKGSSDTLDSVVGATEAENVRKKASAIETEFIAYDANIFQLTPDGVQEWARKHGVKATFEVEPVDVAVKAADANDFALPSVDLLKVNLKVEWFVGGAVLELEVSGSLSPTVLLGAADRKLLEQFEKKAKELRKELLDLEGEKKALEQARQAKEGAQRAADSALRRRHELETGLKDAKQQHWQATMQREQAEAAAKRARANTTKELRKLDPNKMSWDEYKRRSKEIVDKGAREAAELQKAALSARRHELQLDQVVKSRARTIETLDMTGEFKRAVQAAEARVKDAEKVEKSVRRKIERRTARIKGMAKEAADIASKGKSWVFKKLVGPRMLKVLGFIAKAIPFVNIISWAADLYEIGKLLWNWDKLKFGLGGGGGTAGSGSSGTPANSGKGSGSGGTGKPPQPGGGGPGSGGADPWDNTVSPSPVPTPSGGQQPSAKVPTTPNPQGTDKTGQGTKGTGQGQSKTPVPPGKPSAPPGRLPGQGTDPTGKHDGPDAPAGGKGTPGGKGTGGGGKPGQGGGTDPNAKPGNTVKPSGGKQGDAKKGSAIKPSGGKQGDAKPGQGARGGKDNAPGVKAKDVVPQKPRPAIPMRAIKIGPPKANDIDVFKLGATPRIARIAGISLWDSNIGKTGSVTLDVDHEDDAKQQTTYRVYGIPVRVVSRPVDDLPKNEKGLQSYNVEIVMEVTANLRLGSTKLVINSGDQLVYSWEGQY